LGSSPGRSSARGDLFSRNHWMGFLSLGQFLCGRGVARAHVRIFYRRSVSWAYWFSGGRGHGRRHRALRAQHLRTKSPMEFVDCGRPLFRIRGGASDHCIWPAIAISLFSVLVNLRGAEIAQVNDATANSARTWSIGRLLPRLMFLSLLLDLLLRFVPLDPFT